MYQIPTNGYTFWHGGIRGLKMGDEILPPEATDTPHTLLAYSLPIPTEHFDSCKVYVATVRQVAKAFAMLYPGGGALYRVTPKGNIEVDLDCSIAGVSFKSETAIVDRVYDFYVATNPRKALRLLPRYGF